MKGGHKRLRLRWFLVFAVLASIMALPSPLSPVSDIAHATAGGACNRTFADVDAHYYMCDALAYLSTYPAPPTGPAVGGYTCPSGTCFYPHNGVTRGQFSKMLALSFGWTYGGSTQDFSDVPPGSTFYTYIEAAYTRGIISGYGNPTCSNYGVAAPCFLPNNSVTRGQIAKMTSNATGYGDDVSSRQPTYADVASGSTFFTYIERLTIHEADAPYPPDIAQPAGYNACPATSPQKPCYYPNVSANRADAVQAVYLTLPSSSSYAQVFPHRYGGQPGTDWDAIYAYVTTPDPGIIPGNWVATPVGISLLYSTHFVESGAQKYCPTSSTCYNSPYASWSSDDANGYYQNTGIRLTPGQGYTYRSDPDGAGIWKPQWCDANQCQGILNSPNNDTGNLGISYLSYFVVGGESPNLNQHWGNIYIYNVSARHHNGNWTTGSASCYDPLLVPVSAGYGTYSMPCANGSWTVNY